MNPLELLTGRSAKSAPYVNELTVVRRCLDAFEREEIIYCHWKSNEHLASALLGDTDLDLLFSKAQGTKVETLLTILGFRRFTAAPHSRYDGIVDYIGLDERLGKIVHLHVHFELRLGEKFLKSYRVPWEERALRTRIFNEDCRLYTTDPHLELVLLLLRGAVKIRKRDIIRAKSRYPGSGFKREFYWLLERTSRERLAEVSNDLLGPDAVAGIDLVLDSGPSLLSLLRLRRLIARQLRSYRGTTAFSATAKRVYHEATARLAKVRLALTRQPTVRRRINPRGGLIVAFLGVDGSGKSTVTDKVVEEFSKKLDVTRIYFGHGDGTSSSFRKTLIVLKRAFRGSKRESRRAPVNNADQSAGGAARSAASILWDVTIAREKRDNLRRAQAAKHLGQLVICDRYPQQQFHRINDGPRLLYSSKSGILRWLTDWEKRIYSLADTHPPDIVFKLTISPETALRRKPNQPSFEALARKSEIVRSTAFPPTVQVVDVNAERPLEEVIAIVMSNIWARVP